MNNNLLMSFEEYAGVKHKTPYSYSLISGDQELLFFGVNHSNDPEHSQFKMLNKVWKEFTSRNNGAKSAVIVEYPKVPIPADNIEDSIIKYGEVGAGAHLAGREGFELVVGELNQGELIKDLRGQFKNEEILLFYEIHAMSYWLKNKERIFSSTSLDVFLGKHTDKYQRLLNWSNLNITREFLQDIFYNVAGEHLIINNAKYLNSYTDPTLNKSRINEYSRAQSLARNYHILDVIEGYWKSIYNIFIIYGAGHAVMQERAIRDMVKNLF